MKMPARVRFQTEYNSSFKGHDSDATKIARSPILKPRFSERVNGQEENESDSEAGLKSSNVHIAREPPLQHKKIVEHIKNHNIKTTSTTQQIDETRSSPSSKKGANPILQYAAHVDKANEANHQKPKLVRFDNDAIQNAKLAGKESENLRYLALEPPMQRKRRSPYNFNHNILRTSTVEYRNGNPNDIELSGEPGEPQAIDGKALETVKRKLEFEQPASIAAPVEKLMPANITDYRLQKETTVESRKANDQKLVVGKEKRRKKSPVKEQRKKDLVEVKNKQTERVDRSLALKAGLQTIAPPHYSHSIQTEYQRQFAWKEPIRHEIHAVKAVQPETEISVSNSDSFPKKKYKPFRTEYQLQFKEYPLIKHTPEISIENAQTAAGDAQEQGNDRKGKAIVDRRLLHQSRNIQPLFYPRGKNSLVTEYKANFLEPFKFGAKKETLQAKTSAEQNAELKVKSADNLDWFREVLRLREKAESYKARTRETHYPTVFLASLEDDDSDSVEENPAKSVAGIGNEATCNAAKENEKKINEEISNAAIEKAGADEYVTESNEIYDDSEERHEGSDDSEFCQEEKTAITKIANGVCRSNSEKNIKSTTVKSSTKPRKSTINSKGASKKRYQNSNGNQFVRAKDMQKSEVVVEADEKPAIARPDFSSSSDESDSVMSLLKGRIGTARLKSGSDHRRHNLDRTTPVRGGTIEGPGQKVSSEITAPVHEFRTLSHDTEPKHPKKFSDEDRKLMMVTKKKSKNERSFVDDGKTGVIRETRPVPSQKTYRHDRYEDKENEGDLLLSDLENKDVVIERPVYKSKTHQRGEELPAMKYSKTLRPPRSVVQPSEIGQQLEDRNRFDQSDILSDTSMSARDSVISDVLERSRRRRDNFW